MLTDEEVVEVRRLTTDLASHYDSVEDPAFLQDVGVYAQELPRRLRAFLHGFRLRDDGAAVCVVSGYPVDDSKIGPTPRHWKESRDLPSSHEEDVYLMLLGALLGDAIAWSTQQDGRILHDVLPIKGHEAEQLGSGCEQPLWWHVEDAFHECRGDFLAMMCLRNPDRVATTVASVSEIQLAESDRCLLSEPHFTIKPDESHLPKNQSDRQRSTGDSAGAYAAIEEMQVKPGRIPVLFGGRQTPYWRLDPYFMDRVEDPPGAQQALGRLIDAVDERLADLVLQPGDVCILDNYRSIHGRQPFKARFDGSDRWLKRINVARDLRKSRAYREGPMSRVLG